jgi:hypothetical protein
MPWPGSSGNGRENARLQTTPDARDRSGSAVWREIEGGTRRHEAAVPGAAEIPLAALEGELRRPPNLSSSNETSAA